MVKLRVYELAKDLNMTNRELLNKMKELKIEVKSHMSSLEDSDVDTIKKKVGNKNLKIWTQNKEKIGKRLDLSKLPDIGLPSYSIINLTQSKHKKDKDTIKRVNIKEGASGHTYDTLFEKFIEGTKKIIISEPYIQENYQIANFARFCGFLIRCGTIESITLITKSLNSSKEKSKDQEIGLKIIKKDLMTNEIKFKVTFDEKVHIRKIEFDNGWEITSDRGLDIYHAPRGNFFGIEENDFYFRKCRKTEINIFQSDMVQDK